MFKILSISLLKSITVRATWLSSHLASAVCTSRCVTRRMGFGGAQSSSCIGTGTYFTEKNVSGEETVLLLYPFNHHGFESNTYSTGLLLICTAESMSAMACQFSIVNDMERIVIAGSYFYQNNYIEQFK